MHRFLISSLILSSGCSEYQMGSQKSDASIPLFDTGSPDAPVVIETPDSESESDPPADPPPPEEEEEDDCLEDSTAFDIEEVSGLQDAFGLPVVRDGLSMAVGSAHFSDGRSWRPSTVEVLVMYPAWYFEYYDDSNSLTVNFHPSSTPAGSTPFSRTIQIRKSELDWTPITLPFDADWSGDDREQMGAWLTFELASVVGENWLEGSDYFVSLGWDDMGFPNVGYSNFELSCTSNWTDYGVGSYVQNSGEDCSWPMLKIEIETLQPGDCE